MKHKILFLLVFMGSFSLHGMERYLTPLPFIAQDWPSVGEVSDANSLQLPMITWGGDLAAFYANGQALSTQKDSLFNNLGLNLTLVRQDDFREQVAAYLRGDTPFLRGTLGMIAQAMPKLLQDPRTEPLVFLQLSWSAGGDALIVGGGIRQLDDLQGKTIGLQAYGPHSDYFIQLLKDALLPLDSVTVRWLPDLTGTENSPAAAFRDQELNAAFIISSDAPSLIANADLPTPPRVLLSTQVANRLIADVYVVRRDFYERNHEAIQKLIVGLLQGQHAVAQLAHQPDSHFWPQAATVFLDDAALYEDLLALYHDADIVLLEGNRKFLTTNNFPRRLERLWPRIAEGLQQLGMIGELASIVVADLDFNALQQQLPDERPVQQSEVTWSTQRGEGDMLFRLEIPFNANETTFDAEHYQNELLRILDLMAAYEGTLLRIEGHSDPSPLLEMKNDGSPAWQLNRLRQQARNLSLQRAFSLQNQLTHLANRHHLPLVSTRLQVWGQGISDPKTGLCHDWPCRIADEAAWLSNLRGEFQLISADHLSIRIPQITP